MNRDQYIQQFGPLMSKLCQGTGLFASVMIAQGIIETATKQPDSSYAPGTSKLFYAHNHFGIKAQQNDGWTGQRIQVTTWEVINNKRIVIKDWFRVYPTVEAGFVDRIEFLKKNTRYRAYGVFRAISPEQQAKALKIAGYATDPDYPAKIISIIQKYRLKIYDISTAITA